MKQMGCWISIPALDNSLVDMRVDFRRIIGLVADPDYNTFILLDSGEKLVSSWGVEEIEDLLRKAVDAYNKRIEKGYQVII
jgi:hypothetical protein